MINGEPITRSVLTAGQVLSSAASHRGSVRDHNEDRFVNRPDLGLWAVADGAGGHQGGEIAATLVADTLRAVPAGLGSAALLAEVRLRIERAHERLQEEAIRRGGDILATTVVVLLARAGHYACLWAGDSRAYLLRGGMLHPVSRDHSLVQELLDAGEITPAEAATHPRSNIITRAVGARNAAVNLDKVTNRLRSGDRFLLCSDGLSKALRDDEIARLLVDGDDAPAARLVTAALERHADDNVTAVVIDLLPEPATPPIDHELTRRW
jgi:protein phosphatase/serine/threonine-protein phosphatase Stp1